MTETADPGSPDPPSRIWASLGLTVRTELHAGHQSRVFLASGRVGEVVVKLTEVGDGPAAARARRMVELVRCLADENPDVVGPIDLGAGLVTEIDGWRVVGYPHVDGAPPDPDDPDAVRAMGATLARLHRSLAAQPDPDLPPVAALRVSPTESSGRNQLIHGDFGGANLITTPTGLRVIDFDDCGLGTREFDIGNSLYLDLFDAWHGGRLDRQHRFRSWFVEAYQTAAPEPIDLEAVDAGVATRVAALARWLVDPSDAPLGIRTASVEWRQRLRVFVDTVGGGAAGGA